MTIKKKMYFLSVLLIVLIIAFALIGLNSKNWQYALSKRIPKLVAIVLTGSAIAFSSTVFQTITNNRILTPSVLGLDSLYVFIQTFIVFAFGSTTLANLGRNFNFIISVVLMILFSMILFQTFFKKGKKNIFFLLLFGMILGTFFQSLSTFMQVLIDPNEFFVVQNKMFVSFNNINTELVWLAFIGILAVSIYTLKYLKDLDVLSLGRENAINLGVQYNKVVKTMLVIISILVSISTALVGPITFLGLLVANISREFLDTYKHKYLITGAMLISSIALVGGQLIAERVMNFNTPINVIINLVGGIYFIYLILKEGKFV